MAPRALQPLRGLLQQSNPDVALHYWDWTQDPRAASDGQGGTVDLSSSTLFGTMNGMVDGPLVHPVFAALLPRLLVSLPIPAEAPVAVPVLPDVDPVRTVLLRHQIGRRGPPRGF